MKRLLIKYGYVTLIWVLLTWSLPVFSQNGDISTEQQRILEDFIESLEGEEEFDFDTLFENLNIYLNTPLNLNQASEEDLKELRILNDLEINQILTHRSSHGDFISMYELQSVPSLNLQKIRLLSQICTVHESNRDFHLGMGQMLKNVEHTLFFKTRRVLEDQRGYTEDEEGQTPYIGDKNRYYLRYSSVFENKLKFGFTAEKDAGEAFFTNNNQYGFDFYSAHFHLRDFNKLLKDVVIGDYSINFGQGLILHNSFGSGKSSLVMDVKKGGRTLNTYSSVNEINFFRGVGATINLSDHIESTAFYSRRKIDALVIANEDIEEEIALTFRSIDQDGFHRTDSEIEKKNTLTRSSAGFNLKYKRPNFSVGFNSLYEQFDKTFLRLSSLFNQFGFVGDQLLNLSADYSFRYKNISGFGEVAWSDNGAMAQLHGLLIGLDKNLDMSIVYRNFDVDYHNLLSNAFAETSGAINEKGIYLGLSLRPHDQWTINAYADIWKHPWLRFAKDAPSVGSEYLIRVEYFQKRKLSFYVRLKYEQKQINETGDDNPIDRLQTIDLYRTRIHLSNKITKSLELRNRIEVSHFASSQKTSNGFLVYQDVIYRPAGSKLSLSSRFMLFDIDDFDSRIYTYENDLLYEFFIPAFQGIGKRFYLNLRYDWTSDLTTEFRIAQTNFNNRDQIGSNNELIDGNTRSEIKAQIRYQF